MFETTVHGTTMPGRFGEIEDAGVVAWNDRGFDGAWRIRTGSRMHPDYAHPEFGGNFTGGRMLTPDQAEKYAAILLAAAQWARAQNGLEQAGVI